ncbi:lytic transglycosylase domain-containing protein [Burkholderia pyrrocinia]|uniref:lytic transglycosylase domain-containing protein n=1 Tax=Burkholderia pyrrocinia TaxID=60550 RepID=UPI001BCA81FD|nr:lytic transglycosylase domain-containing protein [Burkholderia pyrrocinia]QVN18974.1 lytic transglycosylase domain-containing protein [Burkholderia pyrrocinia]
MGVIDFMTLAQQCAPHVAPATMAAIVRTESGFNPYAIGVVNGRLVRQPRTLAEATATVDALERGGWNYSVGLSQVNRQHFARYGLSSTTAFDVCRNLQAGADILSRCYAQATGRTRQPQTALRDGLSCYYSGNFQTGYRTGYVQRVVMNASQGGDGEVVPAIDGSSVIPVVPSKRASANRAPNRVRVERVQPDGAQSEPALPTAPVQSNSAVVF